MKEFLKIMLNGIQIVCMSCSSIVFFMLAYSLFELFVNAVGFAALGLALLIIVSIIMGFVMIFLLGVSA